MVRGGDVARASRQMAIADAGTMTAWRGNPMRHFAVVTSLLVAWLVPSSADAQRVVAETFMIPAVDPGIQLHVRNRRLEGRDSFPGERVVLFVHGATYPSETVFDIDLPGDSWAEHVARKGYDVYLVDVRGYGRSTRPVAMDAPPAENPPFATTVDAVKDVGAAVDFILKRRGISKLNLVGWSWGTAIMAGYTMNNNERVNKLVLYAPLWHLKAPPPFSGAGAYRTAPVKLCANVAFAEFRRSVASKSVRPRGSTPGGWPLSRPILWARSRIRR